MSKSLTPRIDAAEYKLQRTGFGVVEADFARQLEIELDECRARLFADTKVCCGEWDTCEERCIPLVKALRAKLGTDAALRKDAERYRWLRDGYDGYRTRSKDIYVSNAAGVHINLDAAIDTAIEQERKT